FCRPRRAAAPLSAGVCRRSARTRRAWRTGRSRRTWSGRARRSSRTRCDWRATPPTWHTRRTASTSGAELRGARRCGLRFHWRHFHGQRRRTLGRLMTVVTCRTGDRDVFLVRVERGHHLDHLARGLLRISIVLVILRAFRADDVTEVAAHAERRGEILHRDRQLIGANLENLNILVFVRRGRPLHRRRGLWR